VLFQIDAQVRGAIDDVLSVDRSRKRFVFHLFPYRLGIAFGQRLVRLYQGACRNKSGKLIAGEQRLLEPTLTRNPTVVRVRQNRAPNFLRHTALLQNLTALERMLLR
jgi:hypothetical protein